MGSVEEICLVNRTVCVDREHRDLLPYFYPAYSFESDLRRVRGRRVIYDGQASPSTFNVLREKALSFIMISDVARHDIYLNSPEDWLRFVMSRYGRSPGQSVVQGLSGMSDELFRYFLKVYWVIGQYPVKIESQDTRVFALYRSFFGSKREFVAEFLQCIEEMGFPYTESVLTTFVMKSAGWDSVVTQSSNYRGLLRRFWESCGKRVDGVFFEYFRGVRCPVNLMDTFLKLRGK